MESRGVWKVEVPSISWGCLGASHIVRRRTSPKARTKQLCVETNSLATNSPRKVIEFRRQLSTKPTLYLLAARSPKHNPDVATTSNTTILEPLSQPLLGPRL